MHAACVNKQITLAASRDRTRFFGVEGRDTDHKSNTMAQHKTKKYVYTNKQAQLGWVRHSILGFKL